MPSSILLQLKRLFPMQSLATVLGQVWSVPDRARVGGCCQTWLVLFPLDPSAGTGTKAIQPRGRNTLITRFTPGGGKGPPPDEQFSL